MIIAIKKLINGEGQYFLAVNSNKWDIDSPEVVTINDTTFTVVRSNSKAVTPVDYDTNGNGHMQSNEYHAEQKLYSYIQDNFSGSSAKVTVAIQNTSKRLNNQGMCLGCNANTPVFAADNPNLDLDIYHGSTKENP